MKLKLILVITHGINHLISSLMQEKYVALTSDEKMKDNNNMIFGNTHHPVEIKKISLRIWKLRDEIEQSLADAHQETDPEKRQEKIKLIEKTYTNLNGSIAEVIALNEESNTNSKKDVTAPEDEEMSSTDDDPQIDSEALLGDETPEDKPEDKPEPTENSNLIPFTTQSPELPADKISEGVCLLVDIDMQDILFFSKDYFIEGQSVVIEFMVPSKFNVIAEITRSVNYNLKSRIISESRPSYRLAARLKLVRPGDRTLMRKFLASIQPDIPKDKKKVERNQDKGDLDDFDFS